MFKQEFPIQLPETEGQAPMQEMKGQGNLKNRRQPHVEEHSRSKKARV
jgi:hypothetical protein